MKTTSIFLFVCMLSMIAHADISLIEGSVHRGSGDFTLNQRNTVWDLEDAARERGASSIKSVVAYVAISDDRDFFVLDRSLILGRINLVDKSVSGPWQLTRWRNQYFLPALSEQYQFIGLEYPVPISYEYIAPGLGCLGNKPLRYGDIEEDGSEDIVVILNNFLTILSSGSGNVVFAEYLSASDWLTNSEMEDSYGDKRDVLQYQYASRLMADNDRFGPALRAYSKLYFGDFDQDENPDILVWRKLYRTKERDDSERGFTKELDVYQHFERDLVAQSSSSSGETGEYLPQGTDTDKVVQWLQENQLSWQKGYPSKSECPAEEGQLIPESHDSLLNDPDVLR